MNDICVIRTRYSSFDMGHLAHLMLFIKSLPARLAASFALLKGPAPSKAAGVVRAGVWAGLRPPPARPHGVPPSITFWVSLSRVSSGAFPRQQAFSGVGRWLFWASQGLCEVSYRYRTILRLTSSHQDKGFGQLKVFLVSQWLVSEIDPRLYPHRCGQGRSFDA